MTIETNVTFPLSRPPGRSRGELSQAMIDMEVGATIRTDDLSKASQVHALSGLIGRKREYRTAKRGEWLYIYRIGPEVKP